MFPILQGKDIFNPNTRKPSRIEIILGVVLWICIILGATVGLITSIICRFGE